MTETKTIFRVVGGHSRRSLPEFRRYRIIPYHLIRETNRYYFTQRNGKRELQQKRVTANSQFFDSPEPALANLVTRINQERITMRDSFNESISQNFLSSKFNKTVFLGRFESGLFTVTQHDIIGETDKGYRIAKKGTQYLYFHQSQPHNPDLPIERWVTRDFEMLKSYMELYKEQRERYLDEARAEARALVKEYYEKNG